VAYLYYAFLLSKYVQNIMSRSNSHKEINYDLVAPDFNLSIPLKGIAILWDGMHIQLQLPVFPRPLQSLGSSYSKERKRHLARYKE